MPDSERMHEAKGVVDQWRGTPSRLAVVVARAAEIASEAVRMRGGGDLTANVDVRYPDGRETFPNDQAFTDGASALPVQRIESIHAMVWSVQHGIAIQITADHERGMALEVEARDDVLAYGARDVLGALLEQDRAPRVTGFKRHLPFVPGLFGVALLGFLVWLVFVSDIDDETFPLVLGGLGALSAIATAAFGNPQPIYSPALELLPHDEPGVRPSQSPKACGQSSHGSTRIRSLAR